ncbi:hypothetical protein [Paucilactobacillus kaifaensis]|uniref:hypothetical protein n=1 Tax=Paucilactobacillus kaifaensis TaxID=2559921 RepID=UPI0010F795A1|nr:hypothetical protein [Paucilactobacillus kaifaensis]
MNSNELILQKIDTLLAEIKTDFDHYNRQQNLNRGIDNIRLSIQMARIASNEIIFLITLLNLIHQRKDKVNDLIEHFGLSKSQLQNEAAKFSRFVTTTDNYYVTLTETSAMQHFLTNKSLMDTTEMNKQIIVDDLIRSVNERQ